RGREAVDAALRLSGDETWFNGDLVAPGENRVKRPVRKQAEPLVGSRDPEDVDVIVRPSPRRLDARIPALHADLALPRSTLRLRARHGEQRQAQYHGESPHGEPSCFRVGHRSPCKRPKAAREAPLKPRPISVFLQINQWLNGFEPRPHGWPSRF